MHSSSALVSCEINSPDFFWCVFMVRFSITDPEDNFSFNLSWDSLVDWFIDCFRHVLTFLYFLCVTFFLILVKCFLNILAVVYFDFYAFISSFPLFVFTVLETFWFGVIWTNPLLLTFVFITFLTFSNVIRIGDLNDFALGLINVFADIYVNSFWFLFNNFFISSLIDSPPFNLAI